MQKMTVHRFQLYDIVTKDDWVTSTRYGTANAIAALNGRIVPNTEIEIDASEIGTEIEGLTARSYSSGKL